MSGDPAAIVRRHLEAFNARDLAALMAGLSEDATWVTGTDRFQGVAALEELFTGAFTELAPRLHAESLLADGNRVVCELREDYTVDGVERSDHIAAFYRVEDRLISAVKIYREGSADVS
jgi:uncharacterized protein